MVGLIVNVDGRMVMAVETARPEGPRAVPPHVGEVHIIAQYRSPPRTASCHGVRFPQLATKEKRPLEQRSLGIIF